MDSTSDQQRIEIIESFITRQLSRNRTPELPVFKALKHIMVAGTAPTVKQLSTDFFLSERQLERQFHKYTGFAPKQFIRIARFHRAMQLYGRHDMRLTDIALDSGYYDQSHFNSDFKQFSGLSPREYFTGQTGATAWRDV